MDTRLTVKARALADMLGVSTRYVRRKDVEGKMPAGVLFGRCRLWYIDEIRAWIKAGCPDRATWESTRENYRY